MKTFWPVCVQSSLLVCHVLPSQCETGLLLELERDRYDVHAFECIRRLINDFEEKNV